MYELIGLVCFCCAVVALYTLPVRGRIQGPPKPIPKNKEESIKKTKDVLASIRKAQEEQKKKKGGDE